MNTKTNARKHHPACTIPCDGALMGLQPMSLPGYLQHLFQPSLIQPRSPHEGVLLTQCAEHNVLKLMELWPDVEELEDAKVGILQMAPQVGIKENITHYLKLFDFMWQKPHAVFMTGLIEQSQEVLSCPNHCLDKRVKVDVVLAQLIS